MTAKKFFYIIIAAVILLGTVSCRPVGQYSSSEAQNNPALTSPETSYIAEEVISNIDVDDFSNCAVTDQYIYYIQTGSDGGSILWRRELAEDAEAVPFYIFSENDLLQAFTVTDAGNVIAAVKNREQGNTELRKLDRKGEVLWKSEFPEQQEELIIFHLFVGDDGRIYASSRQKLFFWNASGELERCLNVSGEMIQQLTDAGEGKVSVMQNRQKGQTLTIYQGTDGKELFQKDFGEDRRWLGDSLYYVEADILVQYQWESDSSRAVLNFTDCGIDISSIRFFQDLGKEGFLIGCGEEDNPAIHLVWLTARETREEAEKEEQSKIQLVIATFNPGNLQGGIVNFNRSHENYELAAKSFATELSGILDQMDSYNLYITSDNPPDIIDLFGETYYHTYAREGYLLDLTPFMEKSEKINKDEFLPRVWEDISVDGKIYTVPRTISISVLACPTELLEEKTSWTIEEYLDLLEQYPNALSGDGASVERVKADILRKALYEGINGFIDWDTGQVFLDGEEFRTILERIAGLEVKEISQSRRELAKSGEVVFWNLSLYGTDELVEAEWLSGQELTLIGFPVSGRQEGERSLNLINYSDMMGIHSASKEPEAAWDYVEEYISGALRSNDYVIRTGKEIFEEKIQEGVGVETWTLEGHLPPATQEHADKVRNAFIEGTYYSAENKPVLDIIAEETAPYFRGEKALEDVLGIIQSRVRIYLDERRP